VTDAPGCVGDLTVDNQTVTGPDSVAAVNSVTVGSDVILDGSGGAVTVEAGNFVAFVAPVEIRHGVTIATTPTPCP
jgi:hypothetical protein